MIKINSSISISKVRPISGVEKTQGLYALGFLLCARHGTNLASESLATGIYRQV